MLPSVVTWKCNIDDNEEHGKKNTNQRNKFRYYKEQKIEQIITKINVRFIKGIVCTVGLRLLM